jgi:DNA-binding CsgD family transcriptional regulator
VADDSHCTGAYAEDPRTSHFLRAGRGSIHHDRVLFDVDEMLRDPRVRKSIDRLKVTYPLEVVVRLPNSAQGIVTVLKSKRDSHATDADIRSYCRLLPHIEQACALGQILECRAATQEILLDALVQKVDGVILLDRAGAPTFVSDPARAILAAGDGLGYSRGAFVTHRASETRRLQELIGASTMLYATSGAEPGGQMLVTRLSGKRPYVLRMMPAPSTERFLIAKNIACVIHLHDLAALRPPSRAALCDVFGLTGREADLAVQLVRCTGLGSAATNARMALNTARNHLQSIFRKTGTANQAEAVQLFGRLG